MKSGEFTGSSIDEAVFHGLMEMGLSIDEVRIEVLQGETKGLFGLGAKLARVRLTQRLDEELEPITVKDTAKSTEPKAAPKKEHIKEKSRQEAQETHKGYDYSEALAKENPAGVFLEGLLKAMGIEANLKAAEVEDGIRIYIESSTKGLLIGRRGETLDAMQYLASLIVNRNRKQEKFFRVTLDTEGYREKREQTLMRLASRQAAKARATGAPVHLEPMNPYESRVLHASLQNNPYVTTHSEGEEPNRRVVITPK
ncbi:MAG TPA: RNA-binding cell elongation regulator Jag/EloR [Clostridia bacterium]|nr:RNA-binding cell elongation regulator Jag/EloR [Clostridia bacterium]